MNESCSLKHCGLWNVGDSLGWMPQRFIEQFFSRKKRPDLGSSGITQGSVRRVDRLRRREMGPSVSLSDYHPQNVLLSIGVLVFWFCSAGNQTRGFTQLANGLLLSSTPGLPRETFKSSSGA